MGVDEGGLIQLIDNIEVITLLYIPLTGGCSEGLGAF